jgi:glycosyltransferase involved in cell wall biosynthesis
MVAARCRRLPFLLSFHSGGHSSRLRTTARGLQFRLLAPLLRNAHRLVAVSRFEQRRFGGLTGIEDSKFAVVNNGGALPPAADVRRIPGRILSCGRLERYKGHHLAIEALPRVRAEVPDAELVILGGGPYEAELQALARRHGVQDSVTIRRVPPDDRAAMSRELAAASVMAAFSSYEAHPVAVLEAVTAGLPVLGFDAAGIGDLVEDGLVEGISPNAGVESRAVRLVSALRADGTEARPVVDVPTWDACAEQVAGLYRAATISGHTGVPQPA